MSAARLTARASFLAGMASSSKERVLGRLLYQPLRLIRHNSIRGPPDLYAKIEQCNPVTRVCPRRDKPGEAAPLQLVYQPAQAEQLIRALGTEASLQVRDALIGPGLRPQGLPSDPNCADRARRIRACEPEAITGCSRTGSRLSQLIL